MKVFRLVLCLAGLVAYVATKQFLASQESVVPSQDAAPSGAECESSGLDSTPPGVCPLSRNAASTKE